MIYKYISFLQNVFNGYDHSTIAGFRSLISAYHDPINGVPVAAESRATALLTGTYNVRSPQPRYTFIWHVKKVINFLVTLSSPNELGMKDLTLTLKMPLALTSAAGASEIGFVDIKYLVKHSSGYTFHFRKTTRHPKKLNIGILSNSAILKKTTICVSANRLIYTLKGLRKHENKIHSSC